MGKRKLPPGIVERHSRACPARSGGSCGKPCSPSYEAWVFSAREGKKIRKTFPTLSAAKAWRADAASALRRGTLAAPSRRTVEQAAGEWLEQARRGEALTRSGATYKPGTLRTHEHDLREYVFPLLGKVRLSELRRRDVQLLVDRLVGTGLAGSTVRNAIMPLRVVCRHAIERDELLVNPTANLRLPASAGTRDRVASPDEAALLLELIPDQDRALWATALYAGLRRGELRALRVDDVDLPAGVIHVRRSWDPVEGEVAPKSEKGTRRVPVAGTLRLILLEHLARTGRRGGELVFGRTASEPFTPGAVNARAMKAWAAAAVGAFLTRRPLPVEIAPIGLHECRHTYVTLMHAAGRSLEEIGDYVGHSSAYMTDRYRHLIEGQREEAAAAFDAFLGAARAAT